MENTNQYKQQQLISTKGKSLEDYILLDSGSTCDTMCNPKFLLDKRPAKNPCQLATNNAISVMDQESTVPGRGTTCVDESHKANIFALFITTIDNFVQMKSWEDNSFWVQPKKFGVNGQPDWERKPWLKFQATDEGLYVFKPSDDFKNKIARLKKNMKLTGVQCIEAINEINQSLDIHSDGLPSM